MAQAHIIHSFFELHFCMFSALLDDSKNTRKITEDIVKIQKPMSISLALAVDLNSNFSIAMIIYISFS